MAGAIQEKITIVGAGIAGLSAALALSRCQIPCRIIEKRDSLSNEGAGIQITPNAFRVLKQFGVSNQLLNVAHKTQAVTVRDGKTDAVIATMPLGEAFQKRYSAPYITLHRADLVYVLSKACHERGVEIVFGDDAATVLKTRSPVIGADGIWSAIRSQVSQVQSRFSGRIAFRTIIDAGANERFDITHDTTITLGAKAHVVYYPMSGGQKLNLVCLTHGDGGDQRWSSPATTDDVLTSLRDWSPTMKELIARGNEWRRWPLYTVDPSARWSGGRTTLIGDAAHGMMPFLAQGGAVALEDAAVLAHKVAENPTIAQAFHAYETVRKQRVMRIWQEAKMNGERYHWGGAKAMIRNVGLKALGGERLLNRYNWIYEWQPPE